MKTVFPRNYAWICGWKKKPMSKFAFGLFALSCVAPAASVYVLVFHIGLWNGFGVLVALVAMHLGVVVTVAGERRLAVHRQEIANVSEYKSFWLLNPSMALAGFRLFSAELADGRRVTLVSRDPLLVEPGFRYVSWASNHVWIDQGSHE